MAHRVYESIVNAVRNGQLKEPFSRDDFRAACLRLGGGTYNAFLDKHAVDNPGKNSHLFIRVAPGDSSAFVHFWTGSNICTPSRGQLTTRCSRQSARHGDANSKRSARAACG